MIGILARSERRKADRGRGSAAEGSLCVLFFLCDMLGPRLPDRDLRLPPEAESGRGRRK